MPYKNPEDRRNYILLYYMENKEWIIQKQKEWQQKNKEQERIRYKIRYINHPERWVNYYKKNKHKIDIYKKQRAQIPEVIERRREYSRNYYKNNKHAYQIYHRKSYLKNIENIRKLGKKYRESHKQETRLRGQKWRKENRDLCNIYTKKWQMKNPEKVKQAARNRYIRKKIFNTLKNKKQ